MSNQVTEDLREQYKHIKEMKEYVHPRYAAMLIERISSAEQQNGVLKGNLDLAVDIKDQLQTQLAKAEADRKMLAQRVIELEEALEGVQWRPITETDLPKKGDEIGSWYTETCVGNDCHDETYWTLAVAGPDHMLGEDIVSTEDMTLENWEELEYTHFRPINPPERLEPQK